MEATSVKNKQTQVSKHGLNLTALEEKVLHMVEMLKAHKSEIASLKEKNKDLQSQIKALESSLVSETKDLEELSQEKMMTKAFVDNLLHSIDSLIEVKEK
jgi:cell division protein FtsB